MFLYLWVGLMVKNINSLIIFCINVKVNKCVFKYANNMNQYENDNNYYLFIHYFVLNNLLKNNTQNI